MSKKILMYATLYICSLSSVPSESKFTPIQRFTRKKLIRRQGRRDLAAVGKRFLAVEDELDPIQRNELDPVGDTKPISRNDTSRSIAAIHGASKLPLQIEDFQIWDNEARTWTPLAPRLQSQENPLDRANEDAFCYGNRYQDLGPNKSLHDLFEHYLRYGQKQGRVWGCMDSPRNDLFQRRSSDRDAQCKEAGCCIFLLEMGYASTDRAVDRYESDFAKKYPQISSGFHYENGQEHLIHMELRRSAFRTDSLAEANAIFFASYDAYGCIAGDSAGCMQSAADVALITQSDHWKASGGADFIFVEGHPRSWRYPEIKRKGIALAVDNSFTDNAGATRIMVPYVPQEMDIAKLEFEQKIYLINFVAGLVGPRRRIMQEFSALSRGGRSDIHIAAYGPRDENITHIDPQDSAGWLRDVARSQFCLLVGGDTDSSRRDVEVMLAGCLPISIGRASPFPYEHVINYSSFMAKYTSNVTAATILHAVENISEGKRQEMRDAMKHAVGALDLFSGAGATEALSAVCKAKSLR